MVPDLSDARRVYTFVEGLTEPLRGLVKSHKTSTLLEAVSCTQDLQGAIPKAQAPLLACTPYP